MKTDNNTIHSTTRCLRTKTVSCGGFLLTYRLIKRPNTDHTLYVRYVYDLLVTKHSDREVSGESAVIPAVSSLFDRASEMYDCMVRNTVTPMCVAEFFEEYQSRI